MTAENHAAGAEEEEGLEEGVRQEVQEARDPAADHVVAQTLLLGTLFTVLALLSDGALGRRLFGAPRAGAERLVRWTADWVRRGGESLGLPTHFQSVDGAF